MGLRDMVASVTQRYRAKRVPGPGTGNMAYLPWHTNPMYSEGGPGVTYLRGMRTIQEPQLIQDRQLVVDGVNGLETGDIQLYGLTDMEADNFEFFLNMPGNTPGGFNP